MVKKLVGLGVSLALIAGLSACASKKEAAAVPCPRAVILDEARLISMVNDANQPVASGRVDDVETVCRERRGRIEVTTNILVSFAKGVGAEDQVPRPDVFASLVENGQTVRDKVTDQVKLKFPADLETYSGVVSMPEFAVDPALMAAGASRALEVYVGFQLTPEQLARNRARKQ